MTVVVADMQEWQDSNISLKQEDFAYGIIVFGLAHTWWDQLDVEW
jgi:hypothetical protein